MINGAKFNCALFMELYFRSFDYGMFGKNPEVIIFTIKYIFNGKNNNFTNKTNINGKKYFNRQYAPGRRRVMP